MVSEQDDIVLPEEDLDSSSQDDDEDDVVDDEDDDELPDDDVIINSASPSTSSAAGDSLPIAVASVSAPTVTVALPAFLNGEPSSTSTIVTTVIADPSSNRKGSDTVLVEKKPAIDDSRRLFQRLWTDEDEIELLQGFLEYNTQRGKSVHHGQNDTALFYDQIKSKLQLEFNKNQLMEKLRRLKKKYRNIVNKLSSGKEFYFKSPHDQATFEISRKIWSDLGRIEADDNAIDDEYSNFNPNPNNLNSNNFEVKTEDTGGFFVEKKTPKSRKRSRPQSTLKSDEQRGFNDNSALYKENNNSNNNNNNNDGNFNSGNNNNVQGVIEEAIRNCLSPLFKESLSSVMGGTCAPAMGFGGLAPNLMPLSFGGSMMNFGIPSRDSTDDRWRKQQMLELEVYSKRLELVQDQIKAALEELRSKGG